MNWYQIFYGITVADSIKNFFDATSDIFTFFAVVSFILLIISRIGRVIQISESGSANDETDKVNPEIRAWEYAKTFSGKLFYPMLILALVTWIGYVVTPTKKDCLFIVAGGAVGNFMQSDSSAASLPSDITNFLHLSLKKEIEELDVEDQKDLGVDTTKKGIKVDASGDIMDKLKDMSKDEIIKYLENNGKQN